MTDVSTPREGLELPDGLDLRKTSVASINRRLRELEEPPQGDLKIVGVGGQAGLVTGLQQGLTVNLVGSAGAYLGMLNGAADLDVVGDVGAACGHSMTGGAILVRGHAGHSLGAFARGGFIGVHGTAKEACGLMLSGADVFVRQAVGPRAAYGMRSGNLILGSDAGADLGQECTGGTIYLRGEAVSLAEHIREVRMREADAMRLGLLLVRANIKGAAKDFRVYRPRSLGELANA